MIAVRSRYSALRLCAALLSGIGLIATGGCNSTGVGNPAPVLLGLTSADSETSTTSDPSEVGVTQRAMVVVAELRLVPCDEQTLPASIPGPFAVDLLQGSIVPEPRIEVPPDSDYCGIEAPLTPAVVPSSIAGRSVLLYTRRTDGTEVLLYASIEGTLRAMARPGRMFVEPQGARWIWGLRPSRWVQTGELASTLPTTLSDGRRLIVIDGDRFPTLLEAIRVRLSSQSTVYNDLNGNGRIDADEQNDDNVVADGSTQVDP